MDNRFYESWFNRQHVVLKRKLHPFCFYDALILSLNDSPFLLANPKRFTRADLELAVTVCSRDARVFLNAEFTTSFVQRCKTLAWKFRCRNISLKDGCQSFVNYLDDFNAGPKFWTDQSEGNLRAPWILANVTHIIRTTTFRPEEVWTMPIGQALWYSATIAEQSGSSVIEIMTSEEEAAMAEMGIEV